jgi:hypothetical protein
MRELRKNQSSCWSWNVRVSLNSKIKTFIPETAMPNTDSKQTKLTSPSILHASDAEEKLYMLVTECVGK